jgi:hypothetical protein
VADSFGWCECANTTHYIALRVLALKMYSRTDIPKDARDRAKYARQKGQLSSAIELPRRSSSQHRKNRMLQGRAEWMSLSLCINRRLRFQASLPIPCGTTPLDRIPEKVAGLPQARRHRPLKKHCEFAERMGWLSGIEKDNRKNEPTDPQTARRKAICCRGDHTGLKPDCLTSHMAARFCLRQLRAGLR